MSNPNPSPAPDLAAIEGRLNKMNSTGRIGECMDAMNELLEADIRALLDRVRELEANDFHRMAADIHEWQLATFPQATALSKAKHLQKEAAELVADPTDASEMADILLLLIGAAAVSGVDLLQAVRDKMVINRARKWGKPDADGVVYHVKGGSQ